MSDANSRPFAVHDISCLYILIIGIKYIFRLTNATPLPIVLLVKGAKNMANSLLRTDNEIAAIYHRHKDMLYRICFAYMKSQSETEDSIQDTFVNLIKAAPVFESSGHEKAWLIRAASNVCKNALRHWWRKRESLEDQTELYARDEFKIDETFQVVMGLPDKYKTVVYLYYYEGYDSTEIARILEKPQSTIRYYLSQARTLLRGVIK